LFGLVSARRHERLAREFEAVSKKYSQEKASSLGEARGSPDVAVRLKSAQVGLESANKHTRRLEQANAKGDRALKVLQGRLEDVDHLRRALPETDRGVSMARDHLMAIEAKLDILEGAANVLDLRTRHAIPTSG
jgi:hypothetical protein